MNPSIWFPWLALGCTLLAAAQAWRHGLRTPAWRAWLLLAAGFGLSARWLQSALPAAG